MIIESRANERVKEARKLLLRKERKASGLHLIEGDKLVREAVSSGATIVSCFIEAGFVFTPPEGVLTHAVTRAVLESLCESQTPQGVVAVIETPALTPPEQYPAGLVVVLDGVQDPGNVGAILRSADAFGAAGLLLSPACADPYAPKTLRAAMGSTYHLPVWQGELLPELAQMLQQGFTAVCGDLRGSETLPALSASVALVIGSEGNGVSDAVAETCERFRLTMCGRAESLNASVAAGVLLYVVSEAMPR
ncbi:MAG: RNA methyltransferase [Eubacteriales bacterium]|jgi:TrmH family RNA methyltransferase|nr:RNA methyltransferase [Eubacteriales bacterium]